MTPVGGKIKVGYVLKVFPKLSETFVLNEILELERQGLAVEIFSLNPPMDSRFHGGLSRLRTEVTYLPSSDSVKIWRTIQDEYRSLDIHPTAAGTAFLHALQSSNAGEWNHLLQALHVVSAVRSRGIDHLHAHFATSATLVAMLAHMLSDVSFSFTAHAKDIYHHTADQELLADALERATFAVTVTDHNVARLEECAPLAGSKIHRIYNGIPLGKCMPTPEPSSDPPLILSVGRLVEKKGFPYLVEACRLLKDQGHHFRCTIIGTGREQNELNTLIERLELGDTVSLMGAQSQEAVMETIKQSTLMVLPCIIGEDGNRDALPTVLLEAMALGRSVVSTDLPGVTEIVTDGETGLLVPRRDSVSLAKAVGQLLTDSDLRKAFGQAGRRKAERLFSLSRNVAKLKELFEDAVARDERVAAHREREVV